MMCSQLPHAPPKIYIPSKNWASNTILLAGAHPTGNVSPTTHHCGSPYSAITLPMSWISPATWNQSFSGCFCLIPKIEIAYKAGIWFEMDINHLVRSYQNVYNKMKYLHRCFVAPQNMGVERSNEV